MMSSVNGYYNGTNIVLDENVELAAGQRVIVTIIRDSEQAVRKPVDLSKFVIPTERGKRADEYIREMRENDRI